MNIEELVQNHGNRLLRSAYFLCQSEADAQDLVQETFCQAMGSFNTFRGDSQEYTWLCGILRNQFLNYCRRKKRWFSLEMIFNHPAEKVDPWPEIDKAERHRQLKSALSRLPAKHREILVLRYVEEMKVDEIAGLLNLAPGTVKSRLYHATREMQKRLISVKQIVFQAAGGDPHEM
jgi:RNA polymerase sigma-70 factor, ECF subfamily